MRKTTASFLLACLLWGGLSGGAGRAAAAGGAQEQSDEQWQLPRSRDFGDSIWTEKRKQAGRPAKRRKYQRVGVASSSAVPVKYRKPVAAAAAPAQRRRPAAPPRPTLLWQDVALESSEQLGVTIWRLRRCGRFDDRRCFLRLGDALGRPLFYEAARVTTDSDFRAGDGIQLAVESPVNGYIYVVHQEVYRDGRAGAPKLLYPLREGDNAVGPGRPLLIPAQGAGGAVKVLKMRNEQGRDLAAERLKIIVARRPIGGLFTQERPRGLDPEEVEAWESEWSGRLELFDLEGGDREVMSAREWGAMQAGNDGSRDLTTEDLAPQKLYVVERRRNDGVLITLDLPYGNQGRQ